VDTLDIVLHFDKPSSTETYFHRIGRTGRYGTYGISLMFITEPNELEWVKPWVDDTSDINDRFKNKYTVPTSEKPYFAEFLNGVSNWKGK
jgi:superfamily II DNA/RNA helicase